MTKAEKAARKGRKEFIKMLKKDPTRLDALRFLDGPAGPVPMRLADVCDAAEKELAQLRARVERFAPVEFEVTAFARQLKAESAPDCAGQYDATFIYGYNATGKVISRKIPRATILALL